jgi:hypothetical protein
MLITFNTFLNHKYKSNYKKEKRNIIKHKLDFINYISKNIFENDFIKKIVTSKKSFFYVFSINNNNDFFDISNYIGFVILFKFEHNLYTIPLFAIHNLLRKNGYGTMLLNEIFNKIKNNSFTSFIYLHAIKKHLIFIKNLDLLILLIMN